MSRGSDWIAAKEGLRQIEMVSFGDHGETELLALLIEGDLPARASIYRTTTHVRNGPPVKLDYAADRDLSGDFWQIFAYEMSRRAAWLLKIPVLDVGYREISRAAKIDWSSETNITLAAGRTAARHLGDDVWNCSFEIVDLRVFRKALDRCYDPRKAIRRPVSDSELEKWCDDYAATNLVLPDVEKVVWPAAIAAFPRNKVTKRKVAGFFKRYGYLPGPRKGMSLD